MGIRLRTRRDWPLLFVKLFCYLIFLILLPVLVLSSCYKGGALYCLFMNESVPILATYLSIVVCENLGCCTSASQGVGSVMSPTSALQEIIE